MPYLTPKSSDVWFNLPGVVAAYQPIGAPDKIAAYQNVGADFGMLGRYTATLGTAPAFNPVTGWTFVRTSTQYLLTGIVPTSWAWSYIIAFTGYSTTVAGYVFGSRNAANNRFVGIVPYFNALSGRTYLNGNYVTSGAAVLSGVMGIANLQPYLNGIADGSAIASSTVDTMPQIAIGARNLGGSVDTPVSATVKAFVAVSRVLPASEMFRASKQIAYCDQNPDWSAWGQRRKWFIVGATAGFQAAWTARANNLIGGGVDV